MKTCFHFFAVFYCLGLSAQKPIDDLYLKRSLKEDGKQFQFTVLDDDKRGVWRHNKKKFYYWYKAQHVLSTQGGSSGQLINGDFEVFYSNKQLAQKGAFKKGLKHGEWLYWREDGTLAYSEYWCKGSKKGVQKIYDGNGNETESTEFERNSTRRRVSDSLIIRKKNGKQEEILTFDENNKVIRDEEFENGKLHGKVRIYENGKLIETLKYKEGEQIIKIEKIDESTEAEPKTEAGDGSSTKEKKSKNTKDEKAMDLEKKSLKNLFKKKDKETESGKTKKSKESDKEKKAPKEEKAEAFDKGTGSDRDGGKKKSNKEKKDKAKESEKEEGK